MRLIAVANQKGGVGKTTTVVNLGAGLSYLSRKVLLIDLDVQGNLTAHLGIDSTDVKCTIYDVLMGNVPIDKAIVHREAKKSLALRIGERKVLKNANPLYFIPSSTRLFEIEKKAYSREISISLKRPLKALGGMYDYALIDCPPSLGILTLTTLRAVNEVFIPIQMEFFSIQGMSRLIELIRRLKRYNQELELTGIIPCLYDIRRRLTHQIEGRIRKGFKDKVFKTVIRYNVDCTGATSSGRTIFEHAPRSRGALDYFNLAKEVRRQEKKIQLLSS